MKTATNNQLNWLEAGRVFVRFQLALTKHGLTSHPYSQVLQECPEFTDLQAAFNDLLGVREPEKIQMAFRIGRADRAYIARRRNPSDLLIRNVPASAR